MSDERLDRAIDEVARQMTGGEPPGDLQARVIARLGERPRRTWTIWTFAPVAAAALVIMAIFVARGVQPRERRPDYSADQTAGAMPSTTIRLTPSVDAPAVTKPDTTYEGSASKVRPKADATYTTSEIDALAPPPLDVPTLDVTSLATESIAVAPMDTIAPIPVAPLPTNDERPGTNDQRP